MNMNDASREAAYSAAEIDEAAVWIARLHAPDRSAAVERGFRRWLAQSPAHAAAFESMSNTWDLLGAVPRRPFPRLTRWQRAGFREGFFRATTAVLAVAALVVVAVMILPSKGVITAVGEQRVLTLEDGTRISMNTATRVVVRYSEHERRVTLESGEALFEVAKKGPEFPFVVIARGRSVTALGTSFVVREDDSRLSVTLMEGKVAVAPVGKSDASAPGQVTTLSPGERLTFAQADPPKLDRPSIEKITAWRRGELELEDTPLSEAIDEMNRYSTLELAIEQPQAGSLLVNGIFRTGDTASFAAAVAQSYGFGVRHESHRIVLTGLPGVSR